MLCICFKVSTATISIRLVRKSAWIENPLQKAHEYPAYFPSQEVNQLSQNGEQILKLEFDQLEGGRGRVGIRDVHHLIRKTLGRGARPWITDRLVKVLEANRDGKISWVELKEALDRVIESTRRDVASKGRQFPEWLTSNRKVRQAR